MVVVSQFTAMLDLVERPLASESIRFLRLDGTLSQAAREPSYWLLYAMLVLITWVGLVITAQLKPQIGADGRVFVYLNSAFTPRYDEKVANLYAWHGVEGKLVVNYALQQAWG